MSILHRIVLYNYTANIPCRVERLVQLVSHQQASKYNVMNVLTLFPRTIILPTELSAAAILFNGFFEGQSAKFLK